MGEKSSEMEQKDITAYITDSISKIKDVEERIEKSVSSASQAQKSASAAMMVKRKMLQNTSARIVEHLQPAVRDLASAMEISADTQKLMFDHQKVLANCCRTLFGMCTTNISMIRTTIKTLKKQLAENADEDLSGVARQELMNVLHQLQMQEDLYSKQERMFSRIKELNSKLDEKNLLIDEFNKKINELQIIVSNGNKRLKKIECVLPEFGDFSGMKSSQFQDFLQNKNEKMFILEKRVVLLENELKRKSLISVLVSVLSLFSSLLVFWLCLFRL